MDNVIIKRSIPVRHNVDVFVAGGGPAGVVAAVAAARNGASVYLAEAHTCLGGMGTAGLVPILLGFSDGVNFNADGIGREIYDKIRNPDVPENKYRVVTINAEALKRLYDDMLIEAGVNFTFHTQVMDIEKENSTVTSVILAAKSGMFAVKAKMYIDCTGDGDLAAYAGAPFEKGDAEGNVMPGTLCSMWTDIDYSNRKVHPDAARIEDAIRDGVFSREDRHLPGMWRGFGKSTGIGNIGHEFGLDGTDEVSLTKHYIEGRKLVLEYERYYKEYLKGFEDMKLIATGSLMGVRETRRIIGDYVLVLDDYITRAKFDDEIARFSYSIDQHAAKATKKDFDEFERLMVDLHHKPGENYGIPYRTLTPRNLDNVYVAGRCISTDRHMQSSIRVMGGGFITGQAAGTAAAMAVKNNVDTRGVNVSELQKRLKEMGAFLPNCE